MELKERILQESKELFCQYGLKRITMDDISRHLGVSKKTLYQHFKDKHDLVDTFVSSLLHKQCEDLDHIFSSARDAVHEVFLLVTHLKQMLSMMNPMLFYDVQKYHPEAWLRFRDFRSDTMMTGVMNNLDWGIEDGLYRKELRKDIIATMRVEQVNAIFIQSVFPSAQFYLPDVMSEITEHFLYGLCTIRGHEKINHYKTELKHINAEL
jgi:TetR/AcrR family transcriptional regulator, cholesterol catabolism regulator